jgi:proto-chlorophyllide reductase subunit
MVVECCCGRALHARAVDEESPLLYHLRLGCTQCANWIKISGRLEEIEAMVSESLWSKQGRGELERLPPHISMLVQQEVETYAVKTGRNLVTRAVFLEARNRGKVSWTPGAEQRLSNVPAPIRSMAKLEIEGMAIQRGLAEVTEALMDEAKAKFLGMRK